MTGMALYALVELAKPLLATEYYDINIYNRIKDDPRIIRPDGKKYTEWTIKVHIRKTRKKYAIPLPPRPESKNTLAVIDLLSKGKTKSEIMAELNIKDRYYQLIIQQAKKKGLIL